MKEIWAILFSVVIACTAGCQPQDSGEFGIYLLAEDMPASQLADANLETVALQDKPVVGIADIRAYDRMSHEIQLTDAAYQRILALFPLPVRVDGIPFVVRVGNESIYAGAFWTPLSSISYDGVVIMQPFGSEPKTIGLALGYPSPQAFTGEDPRADGRIIRALEEANKLK